MAGETVVGTTEASRNWIDVHSELVAFGRVAAAAYGWDGEAIFSYLEKPWKWSDEHARWVALGSPAEVSSDALDGTEVA